ncbi:sugar ABC transporter permease [Mycoplasma procyoni]|uniref:sugar ABC transporter permease n=1 Tax=Mycoplasma procyoni TaxID=568784 RepID=UPI00197C059A|nr:sugar ABC transporter permease [Mycoplasma procyoni]MBN3534545.1 sugar ABC transporter permease [Mycoplasma procyoni]
MKNLYQKINWKKTITFFSLLIPFLIFSIATFIVPLSKTISESFVVFLGNKRLVYKIGIENFQNITNDPSFSVALKNSTFLFFVAAPSGIIISFVLAYILNSLLSKLFSKIFINVIYSQFFISSFAIGISFSLLFGEKNIFFSFFNSTYSFSSLKDPLDIKIYFLVFQIWRSISFNIVFFSFLFLKVDNKYKKQIKLDNLNFLTKFRSLYLKEWKASFITIALTNVIYAFLFFPSAIIEPQLIDQLKAHTLASYIIDWINPLNGSVRINFNKAYAASLLTLLYLLFLVIISAIPFISFSIWNKIKQKRGVYV